LEYSAPSQYFFLLAAELQALELMTITPDANYERAKGMLLTAIEKEDPRKCPPWDGTIPIRLSREEGTFLVFWSLLGFRFDTIKQLRPVDINFGQFINNLGLLEDCLVITGWKQKIWGQSGAQLILPCNCAPDGPEEDRKRDCFSCLGGRDLPNLVEWDGLRIEKLLRKLGWGKHLCKRYFIMQVFHRLNRFVNMPKATKVAVNVITGWGSKSEMHERYTSDADKHPAKNLGTRTFIGPMRMIALYASQIEPEVAKAVKSTNRSVESLNKFADLLKEEDCQVIADKPQPVRKRGRPAKN
jgi:hypothetical protein